MTNSKQEMTAMEVGTQSTEREEKGACLLEAACRQAGMEIVAWNSFPAWKEYVEGKIQNPELQGASSSDIQEHVQPFGKYLVVDEEKAVSEEDNAKREKAKHANRVYRKACEEAGLSVCFFSNFGSWNEYVSGNIGEDEFYEKARNEAEKMVAGE